MEAPTSVVATPSFDTFVLSFEASPGGISLTKERAIIKVVRVLPRLKVLKTRELNYNSPFFGLSYAEGPNSNYSAALSLVGSS